MLDFLWNGGKQENTSVFLPKVPPPLPTRYPPPIQQKQAPFGSLTNSRNSPNTSCCLNPKAGSIADNIFNGSIFISSPSLIYHDYKGNALPPKKIIQNRAWDPPSSITYAEIPANTKQIGFTNRSRGSTDVAFC